MRNQIFLTGVFLLSVSMLFSQQRLNNVITYGGLPKASGLNHKTSFSIGLPLVDSYSGINNNGAFGFWSFFLMQPQPPIATASEGDYPDRVELKWVVDVLSPGASNGFKIYRDGNLIGRVDGTQESFTDFDVIPGNLYNYAISALNKYGEGNPEEIVGFVNPNGVITGRVETQTGQPVINAFVTATPNLGKALNFSSKPRYEIDLKNGFSPEKSFSISFWLKYTGITELQNILTLDDSSGSVLSVSSENDLLTIATRNGGLASYDISDKNLEWISTSLTYEDSTGKLTFFFEGNEFTDQTITPFSSDSSGLVLQLGDSVFNGMLDNISLWQKSLDKDDVKRNYTITVGAKETGLWGYWKFDEGQGSKIYDLTDNNQDLKGSFTWSTDIPPVKVGARTDNDGNFIIDGINYGSGTTFTVKAEKKTAIGRSIKMHGPADTLYFNLEHVIDPVNGPYTLERWYKTENGNWTHYAETFDGSMRKYFINGNSGGTALPGESIVFGNDTTYSLETGKEDSILSIDDHAIITNANTSYYDELRIWNIVRTDAEIQYNYNKIVSDADSLKIYFNFNEGIGTTSKNQVGSGILAKLDPDIEWSKDIPLDEYFKHEFNPSARTITLNVSNTATDNVKYTDVSQLRMSGYVKFAGTECYQEGVGFLVDGEPSNPQVKTERDGSFIFEFSPGETHQITPVYEDHTFSPIFKTYINITQPVSGIVFENTTDRQLTVEIYGGNDDHKVNIGEYEITIQSTTNCFSKTVVSSNLNTVINHLPPQKYNVFVKPTAVNTEYFTTVSFDGSETSLVDSNNVVSFNYRSDMQVEILDIPQSASGLNYYVTQLDSVPYRVHAFETYNQGNDVVDVLEGSVNIVDDLAGTTANIELSEGYANGYTIPGPPNLLSGGSHPYQKKIEATVTDETGRQGQNTLWAYIIGDVSLGEQFTTKFSNMVPITVLHRPPGDKSYAYMERGSKYSFKIASLESKKSGFNYLNEYKTGFKSTVEIGIPFTGFQTSFEVEGVGSNGTDLSLTMTKRTLREVEFTLEAKERFATANDPSVSSASIGSDVTLAGDVFVGTSINFNYGTVIQFNFYPANDSVSLDSSISVQENHLKTLFAYSEKNIIESVIPNLVTLAQNESDTATADYYYGEANKWTNWLIENMISRTSISDEIPFEINLDFHKAFKNYDPSIFIYNLYNIYGNFQTAESGAGSAATYVPFASNLAKFVWALIKKPPAGPRLDIAGLISGTIANFIYSGIVNYNINDLSQYNSVDSIIEEFEGVDQYHDYISDLNNEDQYSHKNVSFDAGAIFQEEFTSAKSGLRVYNMNFVLDSKAKFLGLEFESNTAAYVYIRHQFFSLTQRITDNTESQYRQNNTTYGYVLSDDDLGDNFTVDVREDAPYGSPKFELKAGQTSNPWEPNSAARNGVDLLIETTNMVNIPPDQPAVTKLVLGNTSQTGEERTYRLRVDQTSNPGGARVTVNGVTIENYLDFTIPGGQQLEATLAVYRGPSDYIYNGLKLIFEAPDEPVDQIYETTYNQSDTTIAEEGTGYYFRKDVAFNIEYTEPVSGVTLFEPADHWLYTLANHDTMWVTFTDYDTTSQFLKEIQLQYRRYVGSGNIQTLTFPEEQPLSGENNAKTGGANPWIVAYKIPKDSLPQNQNFVRFLWDAASLNDDQYEIRAVTISSNADVPNGASQILSGVIDTHGPLVMGVPEPVDGILETDDEVSVTFNEPIDQAQITPGYIHVTNTQTGDDVFYQLTKAPDKLVFKFDMNDNHWIENQRLEIQIDHIYDVNGNIYEDPLNHSNTVDFEFLVNRNPVHWDGGDISQVKYTDQSLTFTRDLVNDGDIITFDLKDVPSWLTVTPASGTLNQGQRLTVRFDIDNRLKIGLYNQIIFASTLFGDEPLNIDFRNLVHAPDWSVQPYSFEYSMIILAEVYVDSVLSQDTYDHVAFFENDQLVGTAPIEERTVDGSDRYFAFATVYSNRAVHSDLSYRIWDASEGRILTASDSNLTFSANQVYGTVTAPQKLTFTKNVFEEYPLHQGWNWISFNVDVNPDLNTTLADILSHIVQIKDHEHFSTYDEQYGLVGSLDSLGEETAYLVKMTLADTLNLSGYPVDILNRVIHLNKGWNALSFMPQTSMPVDQALQSVVFRTGDIIKSQDQFAMYLEGSGWIGNLEYMHPGIGYFLQLSETGQTLQYPQEVVYGKSGSKNQVESATVQYPEVSKAQLPQWQVEHGKYPYNMSLLVATDLRLFNYTSAANLIIGAFNGDDCVGYGIIDKQTEKDRPVAMITIHGGEEITDDIHFRIFNMDDRSGFVMTETVPFVKDDVIGSFDSPMLLTETAETLDETGHVPSEFALRQNYPNPFNPVTTIEFSLKEASAVKLQIYNTLGQRVRELVNQPYKAGKYRVVWDGKNGFGNEVASGIYFYRIQAGDFVNTKKMLLIR